MVKKYTKSEETQLSENFSSLDFDCKCQLPSCSYTLVDEDLVDGLDRLNDKFGKIEITSAFRCAEHNTAVGGAAHSRHLDGRGADIKSSFADVKELYFAALEIPLFKKGGLGGYPKHLHVDTRIGEARWGREFLYGGEE